MGDEIIKFCHSDDHREEDELLSEAKNLVYIKDVYEILRYALDDRMFIL